MSKGRYRQDMLRRGVLSVFGKAALFFVAYFVTVMLSLAVGEWAQPENVGKGTEILFWPPTGVSLFFTIRYGPRYAPVMLLAIFPAVFLGGEPLDRAISGATGNVLEAWAGWWVLTRFGRFAGRFDGVRPVARLAAASVVGGFAASLSYAAWKFFEGTFQLADWEDALINYGFSNGCSTLVVVPFLFALTARKWSFPRQPVEALIWLLLLLLVASFAFNAVFEVRVNYAFIVFPLVIYAAVRFGPAECALGLVIVMGAIYVSLARYGRMLGEEDMFAVARFVQAFLWVVSVTGLFVAALVAERRRAQEEVLVEKTRSLEVKLREERARLDALRYQINPHFLFNSLTSVAASLSSAPSSNTRQMLAELSDYLRSVLDQPGQDLVPLRDEFASVEKYVAVEQRRYGDDLSVVLRIEPGAGEIPIPVFLLQPLIENAIRHGSATAKGVLEVEISARRDGDNLFVEVSNNGEWIDNPKRRGIGLENIRSRLKLLYDDRAMLEKMSRKGRVGVRITLPTDMNPGRLHAHESPDS